MSQRYGKFLVALVLSAGPVAGQTSDGMIEKMVQYHEQEVIRNLTEQEICEGVFSPGFFSPQDLTTQHLKWSEPTEVADTGAFSFQGPGPNDLTPHPSFQQTPFALLRASREAEEEDELDWLTRVQRVGT